MNVMMCRSALEPLEAGSITGRNCTVCGKPLQISPTGQRQLRERPDMIFLCTDDGLVFLERFHKSTITADSEIHINPNAADAMRAIGLDPLDLVRDPKGKR